ncbi:MAG TPA: T9SS type A sorting domain-containing protein [Bacteroidia bacterium]|nr:T9SS type A sorting domain-containing protein [Bacteroidia bacterium]
MKKNLLTLVCFIGILQIVKAQNTWSQKTSMSGMARMGAVGFSIGTKGYIGTGGNFNSSEYNDFWEYDSATDSWTQKADFGGAPRYRATGFAVASEGYIGTGSGSGQYNDFWVYNPVTNLWTQKANLGGMGRFGSVSFVIGNKVYTGTGTSNSGLTTDFWEYDPGLNAWTQIANFGGLGKIYATAFSIGSKGYAGTGVEVGTAPYGTQDFWEYDTTANTWQQKASLPGIARSEAIGFSIGNYGYIGTGTNEYGFGAVADVWQYNPTTDSWLQMADFGGGLREHAAGFVIGCKAYFGTGFINDDGTTLGNDLWEFDACPSGMEELSQLNVSFYPNPVKENLIIMTNDAIKNSRVIIYNSEGKKVFEKNINLSSQKEINVKSMAAGMYFVEVENEKRKFTEKIIIQ